MPAYTNDSPDASGRRQVAATVLFVVSAMVVTYLPASGQQQLAAILRATVLRPFVSTQETLTTARVRATQADELQRRLDSLVATRTAQGPLAEENRRLRGLLGLAGQLGPSFQAATVVRAGTNGSESTFLVDVGAAAGVRPSAPVISARGLVGVIRDVRADHSVGMDWTHPDFRAGAMIVDGTTYGMVESRRGRFREEDRLVFNGTAFHARLEEGSLVVTSGLGGVFPRGVPIGRLAGVAEAEGGWRKSYWLEPLAEPGAATHVLVAVGEQVPTDLTPAFPPDSVLTEQEIVLSEAVRADSVRLLADSIATLERLLAGAAAESRGNPVPDAPGSASGGRASTDPAPVVSSPQPRGAPPEPRRPGISAPPIQPSVEPGSGATPSTPRAAQPAGPARVGPADSTGTRRLPVPTDTIRLPAGPSGPAPGGAAP